MDEINFAIHLHHMEEGLLRWVKVCQDLEEDPQIRGLEEVFDCIENIKKKADDVHSDSLVLFLCRVEDLLLSVKNGSIPLKRPIFNLLRQCQKHLQECIEALQINPKFSSNYQIIDLQIEQVLQLSEKNQIPDFSTAIAVNQEPVDSKKLGNIFASETNDIVKVPLKRIDDLMNTMSELSVHLDILRDYFENKSSNKKDLINTMAVAYRLGRNVRTQTIVLRLQQLEWLFKKIGKIIQESAVNQSKNIKCKFEGADNCLDKTMLEKIFDPLTHLIKAIIDHSIENYTEREKLNKSKEANLTIAARTQANELIIDIVDDGRGLDVDKILKKLHQIKVFSAKYKPSEEDILQGIFLSKFSKGNKSKDMMFGLNIVKEGIEALAGDIHVTSQKGHGAHFSIHLPIHVSFVESLIVMNNGCRFVVPVRELEEVVDLRNYEVFCDSEGCRTVKLRNGEVVKLESLHNFLFLHPDYKNNRKIVGAKKIGQPALIVRFDHELLALEVDFVFGSQSLILRPLNASLRQISGYVGATILNDGEAVVVLSPRLLIRGCSLKNHTIII